jgi:hypothetical protein
MKKINVLAIALGLFVASCGDAPKATEEKEIQSEEMHDDHAGHDHDAMAEKAAEAEPVAIPEGAKVFFANLKDGQKVKSPVKVQFGVEGMEVEPAGALNEGKGHHHIIIDGASLERGTVVPADSLNIHYGKGQLETELVLPKGEHTLTMQFADGYHQSYGAQLSTTIKVIVE